MKKITRFVSCCFCLFIILTGCNASETNKISVPAETSEKFSEAEILSAMEAVQKRFRTFEGCSHLKLWYDEDEANTVIERYLKYGPGAENGAAVKNIIVLFSEFQVDETGGDGGFQPNSTVSGWSWILIRNSKLSAWSVDEWGYA